MKQTSFTIRKRANNKYQAIIRQKTGVTWNQVESKGGFEKKIQAQQWANKKVSEWQKKIFNEYEDMTIGELKKIYLEDLKERVKETTYLGAISELAINDLDDIIITQVKPIQYRNIIKKGHYGNNKRMCAFYNYLITELKIDIDNPFKKPIYKQQTFRRNVEIKEFNYILSLLKDPELELICKIAYYAGLRIAEILALGIKDIVNNSIKVYKQVSKTRKITTPKSKKGNRIVPIPINLFIEIQKYISSLKCININQRIFPKNYNTYRRKLKNALQNTQSSDVSFHYFRHSYITRLVQNGLDLKTVSYLAGDNLETIVKTYIHLTEDTYGIAQNFIQNKM